MAGFWVSVGSLTAVRRRGQRLPQQLMRRVALWTLKHASHYSRHHLTVTRSLCSVDYYSNEKVEWNASPTRAPPPPPRTMAGSSSLEAVRRKIRSLQEQADATEKRGGSLQRELDYERKLREPARNPTSNPRQ